MRVLHKFLIPLLLVLLTIQFVHAAVAPRAPVAVNLDTHTQAAAQGHDHAAALHAAKGHAAHTTHTAHTAHAGHAEEQATNAATAAESDCPDEAACEACHHHCCSFALGAAQLHTGPVPPHAVLSRPVSRGPQHTPEPFHRPPIVSLA